MGFDPLLTLLLWDSTQPSHKPLPKSSSSWVSWLYSFLHPLQTMIGDSSGGIRLSHSAWHCSKAIPNSLIINHFSMSFGFMRHRTPTVAFFGSDS